MSDLQRGRGREASEAEQFSAQRQPLEDSSVEWRLPESLALGNSRIIFRGEGRLLLNEEND